MNVSNLNFKQHLVCLLVGAGSLVSGLVVRLIPNRFFAWVRLSEPKQANMTRSMLYTVLRRDPTKQVGAVNTALGGAFNIKS